MALGLSPIEIINKGTYPLLSIHPSWSRIPLSTVADVLNEFAFDSAKFNNFLIGKPLIRIRDVGKGNIETFYDGPWTNQYLVQNGDLLIGMDGDFRCAKWHGGEALLNQRVCKIIPKTNSYSSEFLFYILQPYLDAINAETSSVTVKHLSSKTIQQIPLPNPPLPVQQAIVAKIEELFSELDAGVKELQTALARLKTYRQAVIDQALDQKGNNWEVKSLGSLADIRGGVTKGRNLNGKETVMVPYLRVANVQDGYLDLDVIKTIDVLPADVQKYKLEDQDILFTEGGDKDKLGRGTVWNSQIPNCIHQNHIFRARVNLDLLSPIFLTYTAKTTKSRRYFYKVAKQTTNLASINLRQLSSLEIPLPALIIQNQIVSEIEAKLSEADAMETTIRQELARAENLRQSILKQAFAGKLITAAFEEVSREELAEVSEPISPVYGGQKAGQVGEQLSLF